MPTTNFDALLGLLARKTPPGIMQPDGAFDLALGASQSPLKGQRCCIVPVHAPGIP